MRTLRPDLSKKQLLITAAVVAVAIAAYTVWSVWLWNSYSSAVEDRTANAKEVTTKAVDATAANASANVKGLRSASEKLKGIENVCEPSWPIAWQAGIPTLKTRVDDCKTKTRMYTQAKADTDAVVAFLDSEQAVLGVLSPLKTTKKLTNENWGSVISAWQAASADLKQVEVSPEYEPVVAMIQTQLGRTSKAWQQLKAADKAQKRTEYESAYDSLDQAITGIIDSADKSDEILKSLLSKLSNSVQKL